ncbi:MAG: HAMP domain-containing histidine kinase [Elusimicrobia bacterium]|nr:HAMP domain-containing histidine kinase [Elusimicrobiota bacterium]
MTTRFRDDFSTFTAAAVGGALELFLIGILLLDRWSGAAGIASPMTFLALGQAFLVAAGLAAAAASRAFLGPLAAIVRGVELFAQGNLDHRIPPSRVREINDLAAQLNRMAADLRSLEAMKDEFVTTVSHELRSPMAAVEGYARLLADEGGLSPRGKTNLAKIGGNLARLRELVERILDLSSITAGTLAVERRPVDLAAVVSEASALFAEAFQQRGLSLEVLLPPGFPCVTGDPLRVRQIVTNLMDNAIKYNRRGGRVQLIGRVDGGMVELEVRDQGPGIPGDMREAVFDKFRRLPQTDPELSSVKGVGLGLPISRGLARMMCGELRIARSSPDGSGFLLTLPRGAAP